MTEEAPNLERGAETLNSGPIESQEGTGLSVEESRADIEAQMARLQEKLTEIDALPLEVVGSPEGREISKASASSVFDSIRAFGSNIGKRVAGMDDSSRLAKILAPLSAIAIAGPVLLQLARTKWPEVGVALDAMPDMFQQFAHLDLGSWASNLVSGGDASVWLTDTHNTEGMNLLADVASGRYDFNSLSPDQLTLLQDTLPNGTELIGNDIFGMNNGVFAHDGMEMMQHAAGQQNVAELASSNASGAAWATAFPNLAGIGGATLLLGGALNKLGKTARKSFPHPSI